jgi:hypothetical protein
MTPNANMSEAGCRASSNASTARRAALAAFGSGRRSTARFLGVQLGGLGGFSSNRHSVLRAVNLQRQSAHSLAVRRQQRGQGRRRSGKLL